MRAGPPLALALAGLMAACTAGAPAAGGPDTSRGEIVIAADFPLSGADAAGGRPAAQGAEFAVRKAAAMKGFKLTFLPLDDAVSGVHDPQQGVRNVATMVANQKVLGMVGPFNSNVARAEIPVANNASLAMISPSNIEECLTQPRPYCNPQPASLRPTGKNNYFRVAAADSFQGPAMADFAVDTLKLTKAAVLSDNETFGKNVADGFADEFQKKGGTIVVRQNFEWTQTSDYTPFLSKAREGGAQAIYAGATSNTKGCLPRAQMKGIFDDSAYYLGPDALGDQLCLTTAGAEANDHLYISTGTADATQNPSAASVVQGYKALHPKPEDVAIYTFPAYDCARILLDAIVRAISANRGRMPSREQVLDAVTATRDLKLTTGTYSFDQNGDPVAPELAFYQAKAGAWTFVSQEPFGRAT